MKIGNKVKKTRKKTKKKDKKEYEMIIYRRLKNNIKKKK